MYSSQRGDSPQSQKKKGRRTRKDMEDRNFNCRYCPKSYLSNAALYTHVKNKHQNPQNISSKKQDQNVLNEPDIQSNEHEESDHCIIENQKQSPLQKLRNFIKRYFPERNKPLSVTQIQEELEYQQRKIFGPLLAYWHEETEKPTEKQLICINFVLAYFLHLMSKRVSVHCSQFLVKVFYNFRLGVIKQTRKNSICERQNASNLPNHFNAIIMNGHITQAPSADELLSNSQLICKILLYFGQWMYDQKFTDFKTVPNF